MFLQTGIARTPGPSPDVLQAGIASDASTRDVELVNVGLAAIFRLSCSKYWC